MADLIGIDLKNSTRVRLNAAGRECFPDLTRDGIAKNYLKATGEEDHLLVRVMVRGLKGWVTYARAFWELE